MFPIVYFSRDASLEAGTDGERFVKSSRSLDLVWLTRLPRNLHDQAVREAQCRPATEADHRIRILKRQVLVVEEHVDHRAIRWTAAVDRHA